MTRSIFDPNSGETERSGSRNLGADANQISQMPPDIIRGEEDETDEDECVMDMPSAEEIMHPTAARDSTVEAPGENDGQNAGQNVGDIAGETTDDLTDESAAQSTASAQTPPAATSSLPPK